MDNAQGKPKYKFGLLGKNIDYSFSKSYFASKFKNEGLAHSYQNFDIATIEAFTSVIKNTSNLKGLNVTIPYKEMVIPYLDTLDKRAKTIGAVNTIKITKKGKLKGYNTDYYGFKKSIQPYLKPHHKKALILGTGGASKAIAYALQQLDIDFEYVSRQQKKGIKFSYKTLTEADISNYTIIINCTPIGTFPNIEAAPNLPYNAITKNHLLYDLVYNPIETTFLKHGKSKGATTLNGLKMLELQAEKSWRIWTKP